MGIEVQSLKLLLLARQMGVDFGDTLTIGRQDILVDEADVASVFARFGDRVSPRQARALAGNDDRFSGAILERLGARRLDFMDISDFEGATVIHDLNTPLPPELHERYSLVFDGGTLEHVFDCPAAMRTYMALPRIGGHLIVAVPANNEMGHGFYQFSPEFFFRTLTPANGFRLRGVYLAPLYVDGDWLAVADPAAVGGRVGFNAPRAQTYVFAIAEKIAPFADWTTPPLQSDYAAEWQAGEKTTTGHRRSAGARARQVVRALLPDRVAALALHMRAASARPDPRMLTRFSPGRTDI